MSTALATAPARWCSLRRGAVGFGILMGSLGCAAGQLQIPIRITINVQPPESGVVCTAITFGATPLINCVGGAPQSVAGDWGELSSRLVATKDVEYVETTVSW